MSKMSIFLLKYPFLQQPFIAAIFKDGALKHWNDEAKDWLAKEFGRAATPVSKYRKVLDEIDSFVAVEVYTTGHGPKTQWWELPKSAMEKLGRDPLTGPSFGVAEREGIIWVEA